MSVEFNTESNECQNYLNVWILRGHRRRAGKRHCNGNVELSKKTRRQSSSLQSSSHHHRNHAYVYICSCPQHVFFCLKQTQDGNSGTHKLIKMLSNLQYHYKSIKETYVTLNSCINRAPALIFKRNSEHCFLQELTALDPHSINISCYKSSQFFCQQ